MRDLLRRLHYLLNRRRFDQELAEEMEAHREVAARDGGGPFGNTLRLREEARDAWGWTWVDRLGQDLRYAARMLRNSPGFTAAAVLMLAFGIGVNTAAFGFFNLMFLRPLPIREPGSVLRFHRRAPESFSTTMPYPEMAFFKVHSRTLLAILASTPARLAIEGEERPVSAHFVTANFFKELGAGVRLGRPLDPVRDGAPGAAPVVVLSHGFWQRHFGGDPAAVGGTIHLNGKAAIVIGVAYNEFSGLVAESPALWLPLTHQPLFVSGSQLLTSLSGPGRNGDSWGNDGTSVDMWGRLQPGLMPRVAEDELRSLAAELRRRHPAEIWEGEWLPSQPGGYAASVRREMYPVLALVATLVLLILAVACSNLGSLLLARGVAREREIAIRIAVGAGSGRLIRQLLTESVLLALLGSVAGLGLGYCVLRALMALTEAPAWLDPAPDGRVVAFALGIGLLAASLFGLTPALQVARQRQRATLVRHVLIGAQVAASSVLLIVSGLLVRALDHATSTHPGFEHERVVVINPGLASHGYTAGQARAYLDELRTRLRELPGVESVSMATTPPLLGKKTVLRAEIAGRPADIHVNSIDPEFFQTMKVPFLRGRNLSPGDSNGIVVSESLAKRAWPVEDPVGKPFRVGEDSSGAPASHTVVGVARSARLTAPEDPEAVEAYFPAGEGDLPAMVVLARTAASPEGLLPVVAQVAKAIDSKVFPEVGLLKSSYRRRVRNGELGAGAVSLLGVVALLLACAGIVGLVAYGVSQRTREIGIRMALGASSAQVLLVLLHRFARPVVVGLVVGVGSAAALSQILRRQLYGVSSLDPVAYVAAVGLFVVTVTLAALWPARRALRVDPMLALRHE